jgi:predicted nucleic acid-binding protein
MALTFIDANILFRMFAVTPARLERYNSSGTSGSKSLDYAIKTMMKIQSSDPEDAYSTSELALLDVCGVASREGSTDRAGRILQDVLEQQGLSILETSPLSYPLAFAFTLGSGIEARDALHLSVALIRKVTTIATSDLQFARGIEILRDKAVEERLRIPTMVQKMYSLAEHQCLLIERAATSAFSALEVERAPS